MQKPLVSGKEEVIKFIPQRAPIVMVDTLYTLNGAENEAICGLTIESSNIFVNENVFSLGGIIEHMAQSAALQSGYAASLEVGAGEAPKGYIGAVKNMSSHEPICSGDQLITSIIVATQLQQISVVHATVKVNNKVMATGQLHIFQFKG